MKNRGFISTILLVIAAILLLKFWLHIDVLAWFRKPEVQNFFLTLWNDHLKEPLQALVQFIRNFISKNF